MKLNQVLALEKGRKTALHSEISAVHHDTMKVPLLNGHRQTYTPASSETGETHPDKVVHVQLRYQDAIDQISDKLVQLFDLTASKDWTNCDAKSDVVVDDKVFMKDVPVTFLLFMEKELTDLHTMMAKMVELDAAESWDFDQNLGLFTSHPVRQHTTKKLQRPIVLYQATEHHPAQTQLIQEDVIVGWWNTTKTSGAIPKPRKKVILERITKLLDAVKVAREKANSIEAQQPSVGKAIFNFVFA